MFNNPIFSVVFWLATVVWAWWIARSIQANCETDRGQSVVRYGPGIRALAGVGWVLAIAATVVAILEPGFPPWCRIVLPVAAFFLAAVLHTELLHSQVRYDPTGLHIVSPWRGDRIITWQECHRVYFHTFNDSYVIESTTLGKVSLHRYMSGIDSLLAELANHGVTVDVD